MNAGEPMTMEDGVSERRKWARLLLLAGSGCLLVVVLTHVAERWDFLPGMGWGQPDSPGHYLDLFSAIVGIALLVAGYVRSRM